MPAPTNPRRRLPESHRRPLHQIRVHIIAHRRGGAVGTAHRAAVAGDKSRRHRDDTDHQHRSATKIKKTTVAPNVPKARKTTSSSPTGKTFNNHSSAAQQKTPYPCTDMQSTKAQINPQTTSRTSDAATGHISTTKSNGSSTELRHQNSNQPQNIPAATGTGRAGPKTKPKRKSANFYRQDDPGQAGPKTQPSTNHAPTYLHTRLHKTTTTTKGATRVSSVTFLHAVEHITSNQFSIRERIGSLPLPQRRAQLANNHWQTQRRMHQLRTHAPIRRYRRIPIVVVRRRTTRSRASKFGHRQPNRTQNSNTAQTPRPTTGFQRSVTERVRTMGSACELTL